MKKGLLIVIPIAIAVALAVQHKQAMAPQSRAPEVPDTGTVEEAREVGISIQPAAIEQGDPAMVVIKNVGDVSTIRSIIWNGKRLGVFQYNDKPTALVGVDLKMATGVYPLTLTLSDGRIVKKDLVVRKRSIATAPLGIPDQLGGNTPEAEKELLATLAKENAILAAIPTEEKMFWSGEFEFPLKGSIVITDPYGYTRLTGASTISHKGTDFRAAVGTPVYAMNSGVVRLSRNFTDYGGTIVIDHGFGLQTLYMHLSELGVKIGDKVEKGNFIGKSGQTGYAEAPHLHISIKINGISIDPMKFMSLFGVE